MIEHGFAVSFSVSANCRLHHVAVCGGGYVKRCADLQSKLREHCHMNQPEAASELHESGVSSGAQEFGMEFDILLQERFSMLRGAGHLFGQLS